MIITIYLNKLYLYIIPLAVSSEMIQKITKKNKKNREVYQTAMKERILGGLLGLFLGGQMGGVFMQRLAGFYESSLRGVLLFSSTRRMRASTSFLST